MQNTVKALSCELLRRGRDGCKGYAQPWACLQGDRERAAVGNGHIGVSGGYCMLFIQ